MFILFIKILLKFVARDPINDIPSLTIAGQAQAFIWINDGPVYRRIDTSLGLNDWGKDYIELYRR